jgi:hypothetical protein
VSLQQPPWMPPNRRSPQQLQCNRPVIRRPHLNRSEPRPLLYRFDKFLSNHIFLQNEKNIYIRNSTVCDPRTTRRQWHRLEAQQPSMASQECEDGEKSRRACMETNGQPFEAAAVLVRSTARLCCAVPLLGTVPSLPFREGEGVQTPTTYGGPCLLPLHSIPCAVVYHHLAAC